MTLLLPKYRFNKAYPVVIIEHSSKKMTFYRKSKPITKLKYDQDEKKTTLLFHTNTIPFFDIFIAINNFYTLCQYLNTLKLYLKK